MKYLALLGRICYSAIFILSGPHHFEAGTISYAASAGVPMPSVLVPLSGVISILGGLSIALGFKARWGAWLIVLFLVPVTLYMHRFWGIADAQAAQMQMINFMKNLSMLGAAFFFAVVGSGPASLKE
ncbi:MAG TPA: DoxX family protein [Thermoanaerobaculia bacterium]|nr:DoxX family protein [Thermoanaerobaculia bacterium]